MRKCKIHRKARRAVERSRKKKAAKLKKPQNYFKKKSNGKRY